MGRVRVTSVSRALHGPTRKTWAAVAGVLASAVAFASLWPHPPFRPMGGGSDVIARVVLTSLASALAVRLAAPRFAGVFASSIGFLATLPAFFLTPALSLVWLGWTRLRSFGEGYADFVWVYPVVAMPLVSVLVSWSAIRSDWSLYVRTRAARQLRVVWSALLVAVVVAAIVRSVAQPPGRDVERWLRAMTVVGSIPRVEATPSNARSDDVYTIHAARVHRVCERDGCYLAVVTPTGESTFHQWRVGRDAFEVRYDPRLDVLVFTNARVRFAFHRNDGQYFNVRGWHLIVGCAPPLSWAYAGLAGLVASALALLAFRRAPASLLAWRGARAGQLLASGAIDFGDGAAVIRPTDARDLAPGAVMVDFARHAHEHGPFRGSTAHDVIAATTGSHADVEAAIAHVEESGEAFALLLATTACAPLLVEAVCQLGV